MSQPVTHESQIEPEPAIPAPAGEAALIPVTDNFAIWLGRSTTTTRNTYYLSHHCAIW